MERWTERLRTLAPQVFATAAGISLLSLIPVALMLFMGGPLWLLVAVPAGLFVIAAYSLPIIAVMWPLLRTKRKRWEFLAGFLIALPPSIAAKQWMMSEVALWSPKGVLSIIAAAAITAGSLMGIFSHGGANGDSLSA